MGRGRGGIPEERFCPGKCPPLFREVLKIIRGARIKAEALSAVRLRRLTAAREGSFRTQ